MATTSDDFWVDDVGDGWRYVPNPESVTLTVVSADSESDHAVDYAKRRAQAGFHDAMVSQRDLTWFLWREKLPDGVAPKENDIITDGDSVRWCIQRVRYESLAKRFRCETTRL